MPYGRRGGRMLGSEEGRSVFSLSLSLSLSLSCLLPGRWNSSGKTGRGLPAMKRRIRRAYALIRLTAWHAAGRDAIRADDGLLGLMGSEGSVGGAGTRTTREEARELPGSVPVSWRLLAGGGGRHLSDKRSVMLRLGDAPAGKADARAGLSARLAPALHQARRCFGVLRFSPRGERSRMSGIGLRPQKSPPCGGRRHSRWRTGFRDCPREGARSCLQPGMHAVLSEEGGSEDREEGASRLMREKPLPSMLVSSVAGLRPGPKRQPFLLPCGRRCGGRRR